MKLGWLWAAALLAGCGAARQAEAPKTLGGTDEVRAAFDDGADRTRVIALLSPS